MHRPLPLSRRTDSIILSSWYFKETLLPSFLSPPPFPSFTSHFLYHRGPSPGLARARQALNLTLSCTWRNVPLSLRSKHTHCSRMQQIQCSQVVNSCSTGVDEGRHETVFQRVPPASLEQCAGWYGHLVLHCRVLRKCPSTPSGVLDHKLVAPRALLFQQDGQPKIKFSQGQGLPTTMGLQYPRRLRIPWCEGLQTTLQAAGPLNLAPSRLDHPSLKDCCPKFAMEGR